MNDELRHAHARTVAALVGNIPKLNQNEACEIVDSLMALVFETLKVYADEDTYESH
ncbi:MAG: hypothetical protein RL680_973 [Actinomycetota bacterium]|jgi:hypothetical protein